LFAAADFMTQILSKARYNSSRLVRLLSSFGSQPPDISPLSADQRLGSLIDLSDSIRISAAQLRPPIENFEASAVSIERVRGDFLEVRAKLLTGIDTSFAPAERYCRIRLPLFDPDQETAATVEPYQRFYASHQREMDFRIQGLRERTRTVAAGCSPELAQLVKLDTTLSDVMSAHSRRSFAGIPGQLAARFEQMLNSEQLSVAYQQFCRDLKALLNAEIDTRLLPILGLVEALENHIETTP
jgi:hypothetical protein